MLGQTIDDGKEIEKDAERWEIHRQAPTFEEQSPAVEILETGIKVIDLLAPYAKGGKIGLFGGAGVGKTVLIQEPVSYTHLQLEIRQQRYSSQRRKSKVYWRS